ncbi:DMT family transporter [Pelagibacteraceae bacterium]|jgi:drug/metabolite transporter (DMT)-like permease|nr:DMT family transporter [Pelagibacteraceae bacterium]
MNNNIKAILLTVSGSFFAVLMESLIRSAQYDSNVYTIGFLRFLFGLIIIFPYLIKKKFIPYKTKNFKFYFIRGLFNLPMMILGFGALVYVPFEQFKALHFLSPIIVVLLSFIIFREKIYMYRILALVIGFIGMLIIVRPGIVDFNIGTIMILISLTFWSLIIIVSKFVSKDDSPITMVTYQYTLMTIFALPLAIYFWQMPSLQSLIFVFIGAISGTILHLSLALSYKYAELSVTQPVWFSGLIFGSAFGFFVFNETPDVWTWIGGIVVFSSVLLITYNERSKDFKNTKNIVINGN